jgi:hypothetical protein
MLIPVQELEEDDSVYCADIVFEVSTFNKTVLIENVDLSVNVKVDKCFFKVPRRWFEDSSAFRKMFELPIVGNTMPDGSSIERPFRLDGIDPTDFKLLLRVVASRSAGLTRNVLPVQLTQRSYEREDALSIDEWTLVLKLSTMWDFQAVKSKAINEVFHLSEIGSLAKISLAKEYGLFEELIYSLELLAREGIVDEDDMNALGLNYFLKILEVQERTDPASLVITKCNQTQKNHDTAYLILRQNYDFTELLKSGFKDEIEQLEKLNANMNIRGPSIAAGPVHPGEDDAFFDVDVFFFVSCL